MDLSRRKFLVASGVASTLLVSRSRHAQAKKYAISLDKVPALKSVGGWAVVKFRSYKVLLVRTSTTEVKAFSPYCTHMRCQLVYKASGKILDCGCHGSRFDLAGKVKRGPATKDLPTYRAWLRGNRIIVQID